MTALEDPRWTGLSQQRRDELLEKHRDINVWDEWWESVYESTLEHLATIGIETDADRMHFTGFWSQGDGACFTGVVSDWNKFLDHAKVTDPAMRRVIIEYDLTFSSTDRNRRYCHESSVAIDFESWPDNPYDPENDPLRFHARELLHEQLSAAAKQFAELFREQMRKLYSDLEAEHEHLTSDEEVVTYILECCQDELVKDEEEETLDS